MPKTVLDNSDFAAAAKQLGCDEAAVRAVAKVEAGPWGAFMGSVPVILFERHLFHKYTGGKFAEVAPDLSNPVSGGYGRVSKQHVRLARAVELDRDAALKATSWGLFQILGVNFRQAGHETLQSFVTAMFKGVDEHLKAFCAFILNDKRLLIALQKHEWEDFARIYNGPKFYIHAYDQKLATAYATFAEV